jgi:cobalamin biosynthesis Mg chelatase CobN
VRRNRLIHALVPVLGVLIFCGCKTVKSVEDSSKAIEANRTAIEQSTAVITHNAQAISDSTAMIETNKLVVEQSTAAIERNARAVDQINAATDKLKSNKAVLAWIIALVAVLLLTPSVVALFVWWQTRKMMRLWLQREGDQPSKKIRMQD